MKKILVLIVLTITLFSCRESKTEKIFNSLDSIDVIMRSHLHDTVILVNDTLIIVDYSIINGNYTLHNGVTVDYTFVQK